MVFGAVWGGGRAGEEGGGGGGKSSCWWGGGRGGGKRDLSPAMSSAVMASIVAVMTLSVSFLDRPAFSATAERELCLIHWYSS